VFIKNRRENSHFNQTVRSINGEKFKLVKVSMIADLIYVKIKEVVYIEIQ